MKEFVLNHTGAKYLSRYRCSRKKYIMKQCGSTSLTNVKDEHHGREKPSRINKEISQVLKTDAARGTSPNSNEGTRLVAPLNTGENLTEGELVG